MLKKTSEEKNKKSMGKEFKMNNASTTLSTIFKFNAVLLCVLNVFFTFAGIILNSVVIMSLWNSQLRKKLCYFMIFIQACFDLAVVAVVHPVIIYQNISGWITMSFDTSFWIRYLYILVDFSFTALLTMSLERYLALVYPFFHQKFVTKPRLMTCFMLFQLPSGVSFILYKGDRQRMTYKAIYFLIFGALFLIVCTLNIKLFHIARKIRNRANPAVGNFDGSNSEPRNIDTKKIKLTLASLKRISTCLLVLVCLFVCYLPWLVRFAVQMKQPVTRDQNIFLIHLWPETFFTMNSSLNCLIFFYKNSVLRRHGEIFLKNCFCGSLQH